MRGEVFRQVNGAQGVGYMIDVLALLGRCTVQDGAHYVPADGLWVEAIVVPYDDAALFFQQFEGRLGVLLHAFVMVVAIHEDHIVLAKMRAEVKSLRVTVELFHVVQILAKEAVQVGV